MDAITSEAVRVAHEVAAQFWHRGRLFRWGQFEDARQEAVLAALAALPKFDPGRPRANLSGFLDRCVRNHLRAVAIEGRLIRVPRGSAKHALAGPAFRLALGYRPGRSDPPASSEGADAGVEAGVFSERLLARLDGGDRELLRRRFGIDRRRETLRQIAATAGVSFEAVRKREQKALARARRGAGGKPCPFNRASS